MNRQSILSMLESLPIEAVLDLLPRFGYRQLEELPGRGFIFSAATGDQLAVTTNKKFRDYASATLDLLESLVNPATSLEDVIALLVLQDCDIYRHKFDDDLARWGSFPLNSFNEAIPALVDLLRFTAAGVYSQRRNYTKLPEPAQAFGQQCRMGQTEQSSYVVKIFCPTNPLRTQLIHEQEEPFGRLVTRACVENLAFLSETEASDAYSGDLPATMNRNVASAIARLQPMSFHPDASAIVWYSARYTDKTELSTVKINQETYTRAAVVERRLEREAGTERIAFRGYIVDLHKDRPQKRKTISHKITMQVQESTGWRNVSLTLLPSQYRDAVRWHDRNHRVQIDALFDKHATPWHALEIFEFGSLDANQADLFEEEARPTSLPPAR